MPSSPLASLESTVRDLIATYPGLCTLALTNVHTGDHFGVDEDAEMSAASVIKLPVLASLYRAQSEGKLSLADRVSTQAHHRVFGTGVLQHLSPGVEMSLRDAAVLMIIISDNAALELCVDAVGGTDYVNETARSLDMPNTALKISLTEPVNNPDGRNFAVTTAAETCLFLARLARGQLMSPDASSDMLVILKLQQSRDKLARDLPFTEIFTLPPGPAEAWVASKDGINSFRGVRNDAAIFHRASREIAVAAFTELGQTGVTSDHPANALLARIGLSIWDWMDGTP